MGKTKQKQDRSFQSGTGKSDRTFGNRAVIGSFCWDGRFYYGCKCWRSSCVGRVAG